MYICVTICNNNDVQAKKHTVERYTGGCLRRDTTGTIRGKENPQKTV